MPAMSSTEASFALSPESTFCSVTMNPAYSIATSNEPFALLYGNRTNFGLNPRIFRKYFVLLFKLLTTEFCGKLSANEGSYLIPISCPWSTAIRTKSIKVPSVKSDYEMKSDFDIGLS